MFIETTPNEAKMAVLTRIARRRDKQVINTLTKPNGQLSEPGTETIKMLTDAHFPAAREGTEPATKNTSLWVDRETLQDAYIDWIDEGIVRKALIKFKPYKAAGPDGIKPILFKHLPPTSSKPSQPYTKHVSIRATPLMFGEKLKSSSCPNPANPSTPSPRLTDPSHYPIFLLKD